MANIKILFDRQAWVKQTVDEGEEAGFGAPRNQNQIGRFARNQNQIWLKYGFLPRNQMVVQRATARCTVFVRSCVLGLMLEWHLTLVKYCTLVLY